MSDMKGSSSPVAPLDRTRNVVWPRSLRPLVEKNRSTRATRAQPIRQCALYANYVALISEPDARALQEAIDAGTALRTDMLVAADTLAHFRMFDAAQLAEIRAGQGFLDLSADLIAFGGKFHAKWDEDPGKTTARNA